MYLCMRVCVCVCRYKATINCVILPRMRLIDADSTANHKTQGSEVPVYLCADICMHIYTCVCVCVFASVYVASKPRVMPLKMFLMMQTTRPTTKKWLGLAGIYTCMYIYIFVFMYIYIQI